jgi:hypothetical protein
MRLEHSDTAERVHITYYDVSSKHGSGAYAVVVPLHMYATWLSYTEFELREPVFVGYNVVALQGIIRGNPSVWFDDRHGDPRDNFH